MEDFFNFVDLTAQFSKMLIGIGSAFRGFIRLSLRVFRMFELCCVILKKDRALYMWVARMQEYAIACIWIMRDK